MLEIGAASAPTAKPGAAPSAKPVIRAMSVVATTFGNRRQHQPPGDRQRGERRDQRDQPRASASSARTRRSRPARTSARTGEGGGLPGHRARRLPSRRRGERSSAAPCSGVTAPAAPRMRATSVAKYQPPERISSTAPSAITHAVAEQDDAGRDARRRTRRRGWRRAPPRRRPASSLEPGAELGLARAVHPAGRLVEADEPRARSPFSRPAITIASASRSRSPPERSRGSRVDASTRARPPRARAARPRPGSSSPTRSRTSRSAGALRQQRAAAAASAIVPRDRLDQPGGGAQQRALAGAVAAHQRDALAAARREVELAQHLARRRCPESSSTQRSRAASAAPSAPRGDRARRGVGFGRRPPSSIADAAPASGAPPSPRPAAGAMPASENSVTPGGASAGRRRATQSQKPCGSPSNAIRPALEARARGRRRRGSGRAGARRATTAIPHSSLRRRSSPISSSPATGSSCEVGSSSRTSRGRSTSAAASATRCSSPPESVSTGRSIRSAIPSASVTSSIARAARGGGLAAQLERQLELAADGRRDDLGLGVLARRGRRGRRARPGRASRTSSPQTSSEPATSPPW